MNKPTPSNPNIPDDPNSAGPPPRDELDALLRQWHKVNADKAAAGRDRLLKSLPQADAARSGDAREVVASIVPDSHPELRAQSQIEAKPSPFTTLRKVVMNRYSGLVAAAIAVAVLLPFIWTGKGGPVSTVKAQLASNVVMAPDGGRLDAFDKAGDLLGPCVLKHTDVKAEISGRFSRVTVIQKFHNPHADKIEAVYTFPLSDRGGVDRMTMTIGDRVIVGEVKERQAARRIYEQARDSGKVASLLEQERPNIFTQSVANIEPGATIDIEISYVEIVAEHDGEFSFDFPTVVGPRYIPGSPLSPGRDRARPLPSGAQSRRGLVLPAPPIIAKATNHDAKAGDRTADQLARMLVDAAPIAAPAEDPQTLPAVWYEMDVKYPDGSAEPAVLLADGRGVVDGRWFFCPNVASAPGEPFSQPTDKVPDADRITPMPTRPDTRAGHDISISVTIDTGGPGITTLGAPLHDIQRQDLARNALDQPRRASIALKDLAAIPNRDFVIKWKQTAESISHRVFTNTGPNGNFFAVQLDPPARVDDVQAVPRELIFVVDTSGSMNGKPIALCRDLMQKSIDAMRPQDTFNIITFAGATKVMWDRPRPNTTANRDEAQRFIATWEGSGGTEMMTAINAALSQTPADAGQEGGRAQPLTPAQLADLPADGRQVVVEVDDDVIRADEMAKGGDTIDPTLFIRDDLSIRCSTFNLPENYRRRAYSTVGRDDITLKILLRGTWLTDKGNRLFKVASAEFSHDSSVRPLRIVMFLTDAFVGNEFAIIDAIKNNRSTTRVFSFGIGNSVNNWLINQMAIVGGGEPDFVFIDKASDAEASAAVERFNLHTRTPVLTDISVTFNGVQPLDVLPDPTTVRDLYDQRPLTFLGRYAGAGTGSLTIKGQTAQGRWEKTIPVTFPEKEPANSSLPTLWARAKIDGLMAQDLIGAQSGHPNPAIREQIVQLGETFNVMSQYTSFVAVDKLRVTIAGKPRLLHVPIELPDQTNWEGFFGEFAAPPTEAEGKDLRGKTDASLGRPVQLLTLKEDVLGQMLAASDEFQKFTRLESETAANMADATLSMRSAFNNPADKAAKPDAPPPTVGPTGSGGSVATVSPPPSATPPPPATMPVIAGKPAAPPPPAGGRGAGAPRQLGASSVAPGEKAKIKKENAADLSNLHDRLETYYRKTDDDAGERRAEHLSRFAAEPSLLWSRSDTHRRMAESQSADENKRFYGLALELARTESATRKASADDFTVPPQNLADFPSDWPNKSFQRGELGVGYKQVAPNENLVVLAAAQLAESGRIDDAKRLTCSNLVNRAVATGGANNDPSAAAAASDDNNDTNDKKARGGAQNVPQAPVDLLCGALSSNLPDEERKAAINEARAQASNQLLGLRRDATIARKLAPELAMQTSLGQRYRAVREQAAAAPTRAAAPVAQEPTAGLADKDQSTLKQYGSTPTPPPAPTPASGAAAQSIFIAILLADTSTKTLESLKSLGVEIITTRADANVVIARITADKLEELALLDVVKRIEPVPGD